MMRLEVLLSAMNLKDYHYIESLNITGNCVVINQCDQEGEEIYEGGRVRYVKTRERGLSKSRNMAIQKSRGDICILCDNDVEYVKDYEEKIIKAFEKHKEADIIIFYIKRKEKPAPLFPKEKKMGYLSVLKIFSPEIAFRKEKVESLSFHEKFGAGAKYSMGEENIFLYDALKKGLHIHYVPLQIASLRETKSTWFTGYTDKYFRDRGANYCAMSKNLSLFLILQFAVRKRKLYKGENTFFHSLLMMLKGRREWKNQ